MSALPKVLHLVDDTTAGGVMRVLDYLCSDPELAKTAHHDIQTVPRGKIIAPLGKADVIVSHLAVSWRSLPSLMLLRAIYARTPLLHIEHSYTEAFVAHNVTQKRRFTRLLKLAYGCFHRVICVSNEQSRWMVSNGFVPVNKLSTIQSCVDLSAFRALPAPQHPPRVFGAIGRLDDQKGFDTLIKAFRKCDTPDIALHIIGEGARESALRSLAGDDKRIKFKAFQRDTAAALSAVDVVIMPSRWEAYGLVAIETMAAGRRLLCHNIDGLKDHAQHGAILFDTADVEALSLLITTETKVKPSTQRPSIARTSKQFEERFRECWRYLLYEVNNQTIR